MKLSENLKTIRKENNLSQEQLAEKLGVSKEEFVKILLQNESIYLAPDQLIIYKK